eukprot:274111_1
MQLQLKNFNQESAQIRNKIFHALPLFADQTIFIAMKLKQNSQCKITKKIISQWIPILLIVSVLGLITRFALIKRISNTKKKTIGNTETLPSLSQLLLLRSDDNTRIINGSHPTFYHQITSEWQNFDASAMSRNEGYVYVQFTDTDDLQSFESKGFTLTYTFKITLNDSRIINIQFTKQALKKLKNCIWIDLNWNNITKLYGYVDINAHASLMESIRLVIEIQSTQNQNVTIDADTLDLTVHYADILPLNSHNFDTSIKFNAWMNIDESNSFHLNWNQNLTACSNNLVKSDDRGLDGFFKNLTIAYWDKSTLESTNHLFAQSNWNYIPQSLNVAEIMLPVMEIYPIQMIELCIRILDANGYQYNWCINKNITGEFFTKIRRMPILGGGLSHKTCGMMMMFGYINDDGIEPLRHEIFDLDTTKNWKGFQITISIQTKDNYAPKVSPEIGLNGFSHK